MTSSIQTTLQTTLTGAALAAAITLGGLTSAHAQLIQPNNEPFPEEHPIIIATDEAEPLDGLSKGLWIYKDDTMHTGHEWVGVAGGRLTINGLYTNFWDIYHRGGTIYSTNFETNIDRLWVTINTLGSSRDGCFVNVETFILQVGETNVYGESFGVKTADKKIEMFYGNDGKTPALSYGGKHFYANGVNKSTKMKVLNCAGGVMSDVEFYTGTLENNAGGFISRVCQNNGTCYNSGEISRFYQSNGTCYSNGKIAEYTMTGGTLDNSLGYIETLYYGGGNIDARGMNNIGTIIYLNGADEGVTGEGYLDDAGFDDAGWDNGMYPWWIRI